MGHIFGDCILRMFPVFPDRLAAALLLDHARPREPLFAARESLGKRRVDRLPLSEEPGGKR